MKTKGVLVRSPSHFNYILSIPFNLPSLKAYLEAKGHEAVVIDLALDLYNNARSIYDLCQMKVTSYYFPADLARILYPEFFKNTFPEHEEVRKKLEPYVNSACSEILNKSPDYVGFSSYHCTHLFTLLLAQKIKKETKIPIIMGGPEVFQNADYVGFSFASRLVDVAVVGEGEETLLEITEKISQEKPFSGILGTATYDNKTRKISYAPQRPLIKNLDSLPFPDFSDLPINDYPPVYGVSPVLPIAGSRGCPFNCAFCAERAFWRTFRQRSVNSVINELKHNRDEHACFLFYMTDSLINANLKWLEKFCDCLIQENLDIYWIVYARISPMKLELLSKMAKAGCVLLDLGIEHASQKILDSMQKKLKKEKILPFLEEAHKQGMALWTDWIVGFSGEDSKDFEEQLYVLAKGSPYFHAALDNKFLVLGGSSLIDDASRFKLKVTSSKMQMPPELKELGEFAVKRKIVPSLPNEETANFRRFLLRHFANTLLTPFRFKECPSGFKRLYKKILSPNARIALNHDAAVSASLVPMKGRSSKAGEYYGLALVRSWLDYDFIPVIELDEEGYKVIKMCDTEPPLTIAEVAKKVMTTFPNRYASEQEALENTVDFLTYFLFHSFVNVIKRR